MPKKENSTNNINRKFIETQCPVMFTIGKIGGRWKPIILNQLQQEGLRYGELKRKIPEISEKMFIQHLKELEADNLLSKKVVNSIPIQVTYSLTKMGRDLAPIFDAMVKWGRKYH